MKKYLAGVLCAAAITATATSATPTVASALFHGPVLTVTDLLYQPYVKEYWLWAFNQPEATNPLLGNQPFCKQSWDRTTTFLSGTFIEGPQTRSCTVAPGQRLYLSILSTSYINFKSDAPEDKTWAAMLDFADCSDATATVTIDGFFTFDASKSYTKTSKFDFPAAPGGLLEAELGGEQTDGAVVSGIHVMVTPLLRGNHTVSWHAESEKCGIPSKDITYNLNVQ